MSIMASVSCWKFVALLVVFQGIFSLIDGSKVRDLSAADFESLGKSQGKTVIAVHFDRPGKSFPSFYCVIVLLLSFNIYACTSANRNKLKL